MLRAMLRGAAAGAAATTVLNIITYLDMVVRGRPSSTTPERTVERLADVTGTHVPGEPERKQNRVEALGPLLGVLTGLGVGAAYGAARHLGWRPRRSLGAVAVAAAAMAAEAGPMAALGVSDPREWSTVDWLSDVVPHLGYGVAIAMIYDALEN